MIYYNPGRWSLLFALSLQGSVLPKAAVWAAACSGIAVIMSILFKSYDISTGFSTDSSFLSMFGHFSFILGFLVVFRSQQAYSRWWEGGTLLQQLRGEWFNAFSSLMAFTNTDPEYAADVHKFQHRIARLVSLLYSSALQQVQQFKDSSCFELIDLDGFELESMKFLDTTHDRCEVVLQWIQRLIVEAEKKQIIKVAPPILSRVYNQLGNGIVNLNNARKISEFPIPFPLAQMLTIMLICQQLIVAFICAFAIENHWIAAALSFIVMISFWSVNYIAVELEMPFGDDPNDLPLQDMQRDLNRSLKGLLQARALQTPGFTVDSKTNDLILSEVNFDAYVTEHEIELRIKNTKSKMKSKTQMLDNIPGDSRTAGSFAVKGSNRGLEGAAGLGGIEVAGVAGVTTNGIAPASTDLQASRSDGTPPVSALVTPVDPVARSPVSASNPLVRFPDLIAKADEIFRDTEDLKVPIESKDFFSAHMTRPLNDRISNHDREDINFSRNFAFDEELLEKTREMLRLHTSMDGHLLQMLKELQFLSGSSGADNTMDIDRRIPLLSLLPANPRIASEAPRIEQREPKALESVSWSSSCSACRL